jgi:uncharacterized repeat protein (TIGR02543 family)
MIFTLILMATGIQAQTHFTLSSNTGNDMTVIVPLGVNPTMDGVTLANGDEIGVFSPGGLCVGASIWNGSSSIAIAVHGDNDITTMVDGIADNEQLVFRVWDASLTREGSATVAFSTPVGPNYKTDGMAVLSSFSAVSSSSSSYKVTYDGNGNTSGTIPTGAVSYLQGSLVTVWGNTGNLAKTGYPFSGWNTAAGGSGTSYSAGSTFTMGAVNIVLYAKWAVPTYTVTYSGNGNTSGAVPVDGNHYPQSATVTVLDNTGSLARPGYTFSGWNTAANGTGTNYSPDSTFTMGTVNLTLYAIWTVIPTYTVTYNANGNSSGSVPMDANFYPQSDTVTVLDNTGGLTRAGYTFSGWNTAANGTGTNYSAGSTFTMGTADVVLYAQWSLIPTSTVTYNGNGNTSGAVPVDENHYPQSATVTVLDNTGGLARTGYTFAGWNTVADGSGTNYSAGAAFSMGPSTIVLFAQWHVITFSLTIGHIMGTAAAVIDKDTTVSYGDTIRLSAPVFSGGNFTKWRITAGTAALVDSTASAGKIILTAGNATVMAIYGVATSAATRLRRLPKEFDMTYNAGSSTIKIAVPSKPGLADIPVTVCLYDLRGRLMNILANEEMQPGYYTIKIPGGSGAFTSWNICRMNARGFSKTVKISGIGRN